jgi:hypothetical protein
VAGEVFLFQFFDTINRTFSNAGLIGSKASGSAKDAPVTWYSTRDIIDQDYDTSPTSISGYFIGNPYVIDLSTGYSNFTSYDATVNATTIQFTIKIIEENPPGIFTEQSQTYTGDIAAISYSSKNTFFNTIATTMNLAYPSGNFVFEDDKMISSYTKFTFDFSAMHPTLSNTIHGTSSVDALPRDQDIYEYYSENKRIFKYYNNRGVTQILAGVSSRITEVKSVTFLDVNFSQSQIYPSGTAQGITVNSVNSDVYQDFTVTFGTSHDTTVTGNSLELITVYDFYDVNLVDYLMNNSTIALVNNGITIFPIRTISAENPEYYKMDGIVNYYANNGDINFMKKSYGGLSTSTVYKIEMENVNATTNEVIIVYGSWSVTSTRVGSLYTLRFTYIGNAYDGKYDTFEGNDNFINIALLLGYYSSIYGSSLINKDTVVTVTFNSDYPDVDNIAKGKLVRLVSDPTEYDVTFTERTNYPVPSNLYTRYKEYNFLFLTGDGRKNGINTCISVFGRIVLTGVSGKTKEATFEEHASKVQMVRYTVLKSKTAPYDFSCEESGYTSFDVDSNNIDLGDIGINFGPQKNIASNSIAISLMNNTLGNGNHTLYEILDSVIVVTISKYDGTSISSQVKKILEIYGTNFSTFKLTTDDCYMCVLFVNRKFETVNDLATFSRINRSDFTLSQREKNTVVYENLSATKLVIVIPYSQMSTYMKYHYESIKHMGNTVRLPGVMILNAERTLNNYRKNSLVYNVDILS